MASLSSSTCSPDLGECRHATYSETVRFMRICQAEKYQDALESKVNNLCLQLGCFCTGDKPKFVRLGKELAKEIDNLTKKERKLEEELEKDRLYLYVEMVIHVASSIISHARVLSIRVLIVSNKQGMTLILTILKIRASMTIPSFGRSVAYTKAY